MVPKIESLYRLPFSKNDNPNGWIEITTHCNLRCPGCYRGCDRNDIIREHRKADDIKAEILELIRIRNCDIISISGGEPLLHPHLSEIIRFIRDQGLKPWLHTNGLLLTVSLLEELKKAGLDGVIIRMDSLKDQQIGLTEEELNKERLKYAGLISRVKGIHLTFISVVDKRNVSQIPSIIRWAHKNPRLVDFLAFIPMRQVKFTKDDRIDPSNWIYLEDLCETVSGHFPHLTYGSYLGSQLETDEIKWLQSVWVLLDGEIIGYLKPQVIELFQAYHHLRYGKYAYKFGQGRSYVNFLQVLIISFFMKSMRRIAFRYFRLILKHPLKLFRNASIQIMCYIIPPGRHDGQFDLCDGCPDAILFEGKLYPSCGLEEIKLNLNKSTLKEDKRKVAYA